MSTLIYKRVRGHQWTDAWEQLSPSEQEAFLTKLDHILKASGGKRYILLAYDTAQALQAWNSFGIEIFPDLQSLRQHEVLLDRLEVTKYVHMDTVTGEELASLGLALCVTG